MPKAHRWSVSGNTVHFAVFRKYREYAATVVNKIASECLPPLLADRCGRSDKGVRLPKPVHIERGHSKLRHDS